MVCPTANCPAPPNNPIVSTQVVHGRSTKDANHPEWLSSLGLLVATGAQQKGDVLSGQKVTQYLGVMQAPGAGTAWTLNTDLVRNGVPGGPNSFSGFEGSGEPGQPGQIGTQNGSVGYELDFTNWDAESSPGHGPFTVGQYIHAQGSYTSLSALYFDANMGGNAKGWDAGIYFNGEGVIRENTFIDATSSHTSVKILGSHQFGIDSSQASNKMRVIVARAGQTICFNGVYDCVMWDAGRLSFTNKVGRTVFSVDENGNAIFAGTVIQGKGY